MQVGSATQGHQVRSTRIASLQRPCAPAQGTSRTSQHRGATAALTQDVAPG
jgi:hypothetical protein